MCGGIYEEELQEERKLLVSIWRCGGKLYRSYTDGSRDILNLRYYSIRKTSESDFYPRKNLSGSS